MKPPPHAMNPRTKVFVSLAVLFGLLSISMLILVLAGGSGDSIMAIVLALASTGFVVTARRSHRVGNTAPALASSASSPWPVFLRQANPYERFLVLGGTIALVAGAITGLSANAANNESYRANQLLMAIGGIRFYDGDAGSEFSGWMWFGIAVAISGALLLAAFVVIRANRAA